MLRPPIDLMLASTVEQLPEPTGCPGGCRYEPKWDGWRAAAFVTDTTVLLQSRSGRALAAFFPDVRRTLGRHVPAGTVLDGELVVWRTDRQRTDFAALQERVTAGRRLPALVASRPAQYVVFDALAHAGEDLRPRPLRERRAVLERLLADGPTQLPLCPQTGDIALAREWMTAWADLGIEGLVVKGADTLYQPGRRTGGWLKVRIRATTEAIVGGVTGTLTRPETLLVGRYDFRQRLRYAGRTRPLDRRQAAEVAPLLNLSWHGRERATPHPWPQPLPTRWTGQWGAAEPISYVPVDPTLVVELQVDNAYEHGRWRHPAAYVRLRRDLSPYDVPPHRTAAYGTDDG